MFSRSYCYAVWSAIGIMMLSVCGVWVCPSVHPSVCLSVALCIAVVGVDGEKLHRPCVPSKQLHPIHFFRDFFCMMCRSATKHAKKRTDNLPGGTRFCVRACDVS